MKKQYVLLAACVVAAALVLVGSTYAYFSSSVTATSQVVMGEIAVGVFTNDTVPTLYPNHTFSQDAVWLQNQGNIPAYFRAKLEKTWLNAAGLADPGLNPDYIEYTLDADWKPAPDGYLYYQKIVEPGQVVPLVTSVSLNYQSDNAYSGSSGRVNVIPQAVQSQHYTPQTSGGVIVGWPDIV